MTFHSSVDQILLPSLPAHGPLCSPSRPLLAHAPHQPTSPAGRTSHLSPRHPSPRRARQQLEIPIYIPSLNHQRYDHAAWTHEMMSLDRDWTARDLISTNVPIGSVPICTSVLLSLWMSIWYVDTTLVYHPLSPIYLLKTSVVFLDAETGPQELQKFLLCLILGLLLPDFQSTKALSFLNRSLWNFSHISTTIFCIELPWRIFNLGPN